MSNLLNDTIKMEEIFNSTDEVVLKAKLQLAEHYGLKHLANTIKLILIKK
jgi:hypothetical protein